MVKGQWRVLVLAKHPRTAEKINATLGRWGMVVVCCSTVAQAQEVFQLDSPQLVFCEDRLPDGTFRDVLNFYKLSDCKPRLIVMPSSEALLDPDFESSAIKSGAYAVLGLIPEEADIEWVVIRAVREDAKRQVA